MHGRMLDPETGAVIGEGEVQLSDDRRAGNIYCILKSDAWNGGPEDVVILELESAERLDVVIIGVTGPYVLRRADGLDEVGSPVTSFRVRQK